MHRHIKVLTAAAVVVALAGPAAGSDLESKSMKKALLLSLALPGAGQQYMGNKGRARAMFAAEAAIWGSFAAFRVQGSMRKDSYQETARLFAGVGGERDDEYYKLLSYYLSSDDYNVDVMREARFIYPFDRDKQLEYYESNAYFGGDTWSWTSVSKQAEFADTRTKSKEAYRRATLVTGFAVLNRVTSMIDVYLSFRQAEGGSSASYPHLRVEQRACDGFNVYLSKPFF
jgi:hypothetical protein